MLLTLAAVCRLRLTNLAQLDGAHREANQAEFHVGEYSIEQQLGDKLPRDWRTSWLAWYRALVRRCMDNRRVSALFPPTKYRKMAWYIIGLDMGFSFVFPKLTVH